MDLVGNGGTGTNPEQLFAVGYAGCFRSAYSNATRGNIEVNMTVDGASLDDARAA